MSRSLRIFPKLPVCLLFCAFVLGPIVTLPSPANCFSHKDTYRLVYSNLAMFFVPRYDALSGVSVDLVFRDHVKSSLWTIRHGTFMYVILLGVLFLFRKSTIVIALLLPGLTGLWLYGKHAGMAEPGQLLWRLNVIGPDGRLLKLAPFFLVGALLARSPPRVCSVSAAAVAAVFTAFFYRPPFAVLVLWFTLPYCLIVLACPGFLDRFVRHGDFSYGLHLYAFPVRQLVALLGISATSWALGFLMVAIALPLAFLSWRFVESPALALRTALKHSDGIPVPG
jgi:peptidoglycan/LPS O-acetylase OafA/YrhL